MIPNSESNTLFSIAGCNAILCLEHRNRYCHRENKRNDSEREAPRQRKIIRDNHFEADKTEHERKPRSQVNETLHQTGQQEVEGSQAENRANIGSIGNKWITRDCED